MTATKAPSISKVLIILVKFVDLKFLVSASGRIAVQTARVFKSARRTIATKVAFGEELYLCMLSVAGYTASCAETPYLLAIETKVDGLAQGT